MGNVNYDYDTAAIRAEARKIQRCRERIGTEALPRLTKAVAELDGTFQGRAADALDARLTQEAKSLRALSENLACLYAALVNYADALEEKDAQIARLMRAR